jgi:glutathione synthase/RimK-type ligase-like ATP-grasp enzyme
MSLTRKVGLMWHGDREARDSTVLDTSRFAPLGEELSKQGLSGEAVIYNDDFLDEVRILLLGLDAVQVWVNPIVDGRNLSKLDALLREVALKGVRIFTHPDTILRMGTKQVLVDTKEMSWGSEISEYMSLADLENRLPARLVQGPRVLKQMRGHSGGGIWKVEQANNGMIKLRHAQRGCVEEIVTLAEVLNRMSPYFEDGAKMIEQAYQPRLTEGITRVYMVGTKVGGFGHQAINALFPAIGHEGSPTPGPRLYYPPNQAEFQSIGKKMETDWVSELVERLGMNQSELPLLWDADFFLGPKDSRGNDTYVLCEINVSCVTPYPEWANPLIAATLKEKLSDNYRGI